VHPVLFHIGAFLIPSYGAITALGVLLALGLALRTARMAGVDAGKVWNLCILSLFAALAAARLLLVIVNWSALRLHPSWLLELAMVHHPLLAATGALAGAGCAVWYARRNKLPLGATADALFPPLAIALAFEQLGSLASGSGYGVEAGTGVHWAVSYTDPLAAIWSGAPLGVPLHPVQAYAALAFLALGFLLLAWLPVERRKGDVTGLGLMGAGTAIYITELWRDPEGRGSMLIGALHGALDGPQVAGVLLVIAGALVLRERVSSVALSGSASHPFHEEAVKRMGHGTSKAGTDDEAAPVAENGGRA
jgi:phosphatidylglycerol:prolipoprotein diacylglycerol transferase